MEILGLLRVTTSSDPKKDHSMDYMNMQEFVATIEVCRHNTLRELTSNNEDYSHSVDEMDLSGIDNDVYQMEK